jgi:hypothetical protein
VFSAFTLVLYIHLHLIGADSVALCLYVRVVDSYILLLLTASSSLCMLMSISWHHLGIVLDGLLMDPVYLGRMPIS